MPTLDWLNREAAFQVAAQVPTRVLRPHAAGHVVGDPAGAGNLLIQGDNLEHSAGKAIFAMLYKTEQGLAITQQIDKAIGNLRG